MPWRIGDRVAPGPHFPHEPPVGSWVRDRDWFGWHSTAGGWTSERVDRIGLRGDIIIPSVQWPDLVEGFGPLTITALPPQ